jgi:hypothetical protein
MQRSPIPPVAVADIARVFGFLRTLTPGEPDQAASALSVDTELIRAQCVTGSDPNAVFIRTVLLFSLMQGGVIDATAGPRLFEVAARLQLANGEDFDPKDFIEALAGYP